MNEMNDLNGLAATENGTQGWSVNSGATSCRNVGRQVSCHCGLRKTFFLIPNVYSVYEDIKQLG